MKRIKLSLICTAALVLAMSLAGCGRGDSGSAEKQNVTPVNPIERIEDSVIRDSHVGLRPPQNDKGARIEDCPDGKCPGQGDECPDGKCPEQGDECPDGKCPARLLPPRGRRSDGRIVPLPRMRN